MSDTDRPAGWQPSWALPPPLDAPLQPEVVPSVERFTEVSDQVHPSGESAGAGATTNVWPHYQLPPDMPQSPALPAATAGSQVASYYPPALPPAGTGGAPRNNALLIGAVASLAAVVAVAATLLFLHPWSPSDRGTSGNSTVQVQPNVGSTAAGGSDASAYSNATGPTISAACVSSPSHDSSGNPTSYTPDNALDNNPATAWRCDGNGAGQSIQIDLGRPVTLTDIGIIPGLAKTDPYDGTDRYLQCRRISTVQYSFDNGQAFTQQLDTSPTNRTVQSISLPQVATSHVVITIISSVEGSQVGNLPPTDKVAISEIRWSAT